MVLIVSHLSEVSGLRAPTDSKQSQTTIFELWSVEGFETETRSILSNHGRTQRRKSAPMN